MSYEFSREFMEFLKKDQSGEGYSQLELLGFQIKRAFNEQPVAAGLVTECR